MIAGRKLIIAVLGGLVLSVSVHADMTPVASLDSPSRPSVQTDEPVWMRRLWRFCLRSRRMWSRRSRRPRPARS